MINFLNSNITMWIDVHPLTNGETRTVHLGWSPSNVRTAYTDGLNFLTWGIITELDAQLNVLGDLYDSFLGPTMDVLYSQVLVGGTYTTPYLLGAPMSNSGYVVLTKPFIRIQLVDLAAVDHAYLRLYVKAW